MHLLVTSVTTIFVIIYPTQNVITDHISLLQLLYLFLTLVLIRLLNRTCLVQILPDLTSEHLII